MQGANNRVPLQCHQHLRRKSRSGLSARAVSGVRGWQASEAPHPRQDRGGEGTDQDVRLGAAESYRTVGQGHAGGFIDSIRQAPRRPGMAAHAEANGERG